MRKAKNLLVTKASGEILPFSQEKLKRSLLRAGATEDLTDTIIGELTPQLYEGVPTKKIYKWAIRALKNKSKKVAGKYQLKRAIMELGPSGYPFEKFIGEILKKQGYATQVSKIVQGKCVSHEVDVVAEKDDHHFMIECKYHNQPGTVSDVKIPLYIQARFKDVEAAWSQLPGHSGKFHQGWVVTNTRFTVDAIQYGNCAGLKLLGWDYPANNSLRVQIDKLGLYPITCLTSLTKHEKQMLLDRRIVLCQEICNNDILLTEIGVNSARINTIMSEAKQLCIKLNETLKVVELKKHNNP
jgi:hypothetical protein